MELLQSLKWRYATKKMNGEKIAEDKLNRILEATKLTPTSYGLMPYKVIVVESPELKERLKDACYGQTQLVDSSQVLVFATHNITQENIINYIQRIAEERELSVEMLSGFENMLKNSILKMSPEQMTTWAQKQTYIALGFALVAAATEGVDSTPMEGFNPTLVDEILNLSELGLKSSVILTLGYRHQDDDTSNLKKVRWSDEYLFVRK